MGTEYTHPEIVEAASALDAKRAALGAALSTYDGASNELALRASLLADPAIVPLIIDADSSRKERNQSITELDSVAAALKAQALTHVQVIPPPPPPDQVPGSGPIQQRPPPPLPNVPPPPPVTGTWRDPKTFDDGKTIGGILPAGMTLKALAGGYMKADGSGYVDLQGHVEHHYSGAAWGPTYKDTFFRGEIHDGPPVGLHVAGTRWFRAYDVDGVVFDGCVFFMLGKWLQAATEGHGAYLNAFGDVSVLNTIFYKDGANGLQIDWRGGCLDPTKGWYPETVMDASYGFPAEFISPHTGLLGCGLPTKTIRLVNVAMIECGKIRPGAPFICGDSRDGFDLSLFGPGQMVVVENLYQREVEGLPFIDSTKGECRSSVGFLHQDVRRAFPRIAPFVHVKGHKVEGFLNDRAMAHWADATEVVATGLDYVDHGGRDVMLALESTIKHAEIEVVGPPVRLELRDWKDPHRSIAGLSKVLAHGDKWTGDPSSMKF